MRIRFDEQLELLNRKLIEMGALCEDAISASMHTLKNETDKQSAEKAAAVLASLDQELAIAILGRMKTKSAARILNSMERDRAAKLSTAFSTLDDP